MLKSTTSIINANQIATPISFAGNVSLSTGNLILSNTKGIDFSATPGTGTSELFNDYEEGTWTPVLNNFTGTGNVTGSYTKIGRFVYLFAIIIPTTTLASTVAVSFLSGNPFTSAFDGAIVNWSLAYTGQTSSIIVSNNLYAPTILASSSAFYVSCIYSV